MAELLLGTFVYVSEQERKQNRHVRGRLQFRKDVGGHVYLGISGRVL